MKNIVSSLLFFVLIGSASADPFTVGGKAIEVPSPKGFSSVTPQMDSVYRLSLQMVDPANDLLAYYISESDVPAAMKGEIPSLNRTCVIKVNKKLKSMVFISKDFTELKNITKQHNKQILKSVEEKIPALMDKMSKGVSEQLDVDVALKISQMVPLDPHYETDNSLAYSMYINYGVEGSKEAFIVSATATYVNVAEKVLFLYCYGSQEDLEWTRSASISWTGMVMERNALPPSRSSGSGGVDWGSAFEKGIGGAIAGGFIALVLGLFSRLKKK